MFIWRLNKPFNPTELTEITSDMLQSIEWEYEHFETNCFASFSMSAEKAVITWLNVLGKEGWEVLRCDWSTRWLTHASDFKHQRTKEVHISALVKRPLIKGSSPGLCQEQSHATAKPSGQSQDSEGGDDAKAGES